MLFLFDSEKGNCDLSTLVARSMIYWVLKIGVCSCETEASVVVGLRDQGTTIVRVLGPHPNA